MIESEVRQDGSSNDKPKNQPGQGTGSNGEESNEPVRPMQRGRD